MLLSIPFTVFILLLVAVMVALAIAAPQIARHLAESRASAFTHTAYRLRNGILTPAEAEFFRCLEPCLPSSDYRLFTKVRLADIFEVNEDSGRNQVAFNRISSKHVDFLLCDAQTLSILAAIELDDSTHSRFSAQKNDVFKNTLFESCNIPLIRIRAQRRYDPDAIVATIAQHLQPQVPPVI